MGFKSLILGGVAAFLLAVSGPVMAQTPPTPPVRTGLPHADGPFSAIMLILSEDNLSEFKKPANEGPELRPLKTAKVGDKVAIKIVFSGMALDENLGSVVYDIRVLSPDGTVYDTVDHKGLLGFRGATENPEHLYNNAAVVMIRFEEKDLAGLYRVEAVLYDRVGNRRVPLTAEITLVK